VSGAPYTIELTHTIDAAHRVVGHEGGRGKCARLHGHTYAFVVKITAYQLTEEGFVMDFKLIKDALNAWDHRTILWDQDPLSVTEEDRDHGGVVRVPFNPTSENMARAIAEDLAAVLPPGSRVAISVSETPKSKAFFTALTESPPEPPRTPFLNSELS
jgi:6-pyruvoyltetrahydropterin/6-carboxytetrahydropterin synthase